MPVKLRNIFKNPIKLSLKQKMILSLSAIAVILLTSSIISVIEYKIMSTYVSDQIADNIHSINMAQELAESSNDYNLDILAVIGDDDLSSLPDFNQQEFVSHCDSLRDSFADVRKVPGVHAVQEQGGGEEEQGDTVALVRSTSGSEENDSALQCSLNLTET